MKKSEYIISTLKTLVEIPSPSGFTKEVMAFVEKEVEQMGYVSYYTNRGGLIIEVKGHSDKTIGLSAHVDTLGAMVRSINSNGTINFTEVGGYTLQSVEGCYCKLHTREGKVYTGTIDDIAQYAYKKDNGDTVIKLKVSFEDKEKFLGYGYHVEVRVKNE